MYFLKRLSAVSSADRRTTTRFAKVKKNFLGRGAGATQNLRLKQQGGSNLDPRLSLLYFPWDRS